MNVNVIICGIPKDYSLLIKNLKEKFKGYTNLEFYVITNNYISSLNEFEFEIQKILIVKDKYDNNYRNALNYSYKVNQGLNLLEKNFDIYIIIRSDLILLNDLNLNLFQCDDTIYFSLNHKNQFTTNFERLNDNIIISKNINNLQKLLNFHTFLEKNLNYIDVSLFNFIKNNQIKYQEIDTEYKILLYQCTNIIAIAGDSGSGKTTLSTCLKHIYSYDNCLLLETDRYHKWERGHENYNNITHLNPEANNLEKLSEDVYNLKIENEIYQVDYDHSSGKFTNKEKIDSKQNIILTGLHTLFNNSLNTILNLKIFMNTDPDDVKNWKIDRDVKQRGYSLEKIMNQINKRLEDYQNYILIQKEHADMLINFSKNNCNIEIKNKNIITKILNYLTLNKYNFYYQNNNLLINLKNDKPNFKININEDIFLNYYYMEIFCLIYEILN